MKKNNPTVHQKAAFFAVLTAVLSFISNLGWLLTLSTGRLLSIVSTIIFVAVAASAYTMRGKQ